MHYGWILFHQYSQSEFTTEGPFPSKKPKPKTLPVWTVLFISKIAIMYAYIAYMIISVFPFWKGKKAHVCTAEANTDPKHNYLAQSAIGSPLKKETNAVMDGRFTFTRFGFGKVTWLSHWDDSPKVLLFVEHAISMHTIRVDVLCATCCVYASVKECIYIIYNSSSIRL